MLALHAGWLPEADGRSGRLMLWGESAAAPRRAPRQPRAGTPAHPFAVSAAALRELVGALAGAADAEAIAQLPAADGVPLPSADPGLSAEADPAATLGQFTVRGLALGPAAAVTLLTALDAEQPGGGAVAGADLRFWQHAARFALALLCRQRFAPDLQLADGRFVARWRPLLREGDDAQRLAALARAMPAAARALSAHADFALVGPRTALSAFTVAEPRIWYATSTR